jgi:two-component sensor histidine kinase
MPSSSSPALKPRPPVGGPQRQLRVSVAGGSRAPERARKWLQSAVDWVSEEVERTLLLLTCELVSNSVKHGRAHTGDLIEVELRVIEGGIGVLVSDSGPGFSPSRRRAPLEEPGGWGLVLVDRLAERWGVVHDRRTRVWFELDVP